MIVVRNKVDVKLDQSEIIALEQAYYRVADFENQLVHSVAEDELPVGVKDQLLEDVNKIKSDIIFLFEDMGEDTTALLEY